MTVSDENNFDFSKYSITSATYFKHNTNLIIFIFGNDCDLANSINFLNYNGLLDICVNDPINVVTRTNKSNVLSLNYKKKIVFNALPRQQLSFNLNI